MGDINRGNWGLTCSATDDYYYIIMPDATDIDNSPAPCLFIASCTWPRKKEKVHKYRPRGLKRPKSQRYKKISKKKSQRGK